MQGYLQEGSAQILYGLTQLIKTPFTWFVQIPLRLALTAVFGWQHFKQNDGVKSLVAQVEEAIENEHLMQGDIFYLISRLSEKYYKACAMGQEVGDIASIKAYQNQFRTNLKLYSVDSEVNKLIPHFESKLTFFKAKMDIRLENLDERLIKPVEIEEDARAALGPIHGFYS